MINGGNAIWNKYVLIVFRKIAIVSDVFKIMGSSFLTLGAATEKARLPKLSYKPLRTHDIRGIKKNKGVTFHS